MYGLMLLLGMSMYLCICAYKDINNIIVIFSYLSITACYTKDWEQWWKNPDQVSLISAHHFSVSWRVNFTSGTTLPVYG